jgi:carbamoyltransferase
MGYVGFGNVDTEMERRLTSFYKFNKTDSVPGAFDNFIRHFKDYGIQTYDSRFSEQDAKNLAITNQKVFEDLFMEESSDFLDLYPTLPVVFTGGCALNIIHNTKLAQSREVFVPPNPSDTGLAVGLVCSVIRPANIVDCTYLGPEVWDRAELSTHLMSRPYEQMDIGKIANAIANAEIIGVVRDRSEHGPRALGNRSIICDATNPEMKDILNLKIKNREPFRPFSPVVRFEDLSKYFEWEKECRWMSFSPVVKEQYRELLSSVTHVDNTARVQTVTRKQNWFLYDLLTELDKQTGTGVIMNTSFNVAGKPILNTYKEAFQVFDSTEMSALLLENYLFKKS